MATGARRLPVGLDTNTGKLVVGDGNDYEPIGLPEYTGEGDAQMVVGKVNAVTGGSVFSDGQSSLILPPGETDLSSGVGGETGSGLYIPPKGGEFAKWAAAKQRGTATFLAYGDSNVADEGAGGGTHGLDGAFKHGMSAIFAASANLLFASILGDQNASIATSVQSYNPAVSLGDGWVMDNGPATLGGRFFTGAAGSSGRLTFTIPETFDSFDLYYPDSSGGNTAVSVYVDGVLIDTFNQQAAAAGRKKTYVVSRGSHTIQLGCGPAGKVYVTGVVIKDGAASRFVQGGWCGAVASNLSAVADPWSSLNMAKLLAPDFAEVYCTINNCNLNDPVESYHLQINDIVSALATTADGVLCLGYPSASLNVVKGTLDRYAEVLKAVASDYGWAFFDSRKVFGHLNSVAAAKGYRFDGDHPNLAGHTAKANSLLECLQQSGF